MAIHLDDLSQALNSQHQQELYHNIHTIYGDGSKFRADTQFLSKFPNLRYYDGRLLLSKASDLSLITSLDSNKLCLDLAYQIGDAATLHPLVGKISYLELSNLAEAGHYGLIIDHGTAQLFRQNGDTISEPGGEKWLGILDTTGVDAIFDLHLYEQGILSHLPANIHVLLITDPANIQRVEPGHNLTLKWALGVDDFPGAEKTSPHPHVDGLIFPHSSDAHQVIKARPELKALGLHAHRYFNKNFDLDWLSQYPDLELHCWVGTQEMREYVRSLTRHHPAPVHFLQNNPLKKQIV